VHRIHCPQPLLRNRPPPRQKPRVPHHHRLLERPGRRAVLPRRLAEGPGPGATGLYGAGRRHPHENPPRPRAGPPRIHPGVAATGGPAVFGQGGGPRRHGRPPVRRHAPPDGPGSNQIRLPGRSRKVARHGGTAPARRRQPV
ncbi:MAG: hypothetical protein AVDCRST_MAG56-2010, partial [uncultured Cytophagales bacterium]